MIINSLTLHNFMSYSDAGLDLTPVSVACLTGLNGAGKSALLDAITWALWESARAGSDELVRLGQTEMWVDLCFSLENQVYRVRRARQKSYGKAGQQTGSKGQLDLQVFDGDEDAWLAEQKDARTHEGNGKNGSKGKQQAGKWLSLNGSSMRETQRRLKELLRMDYDTFVSSVYLRQGRADEFTTRSPNERKQVFADILGLDYFEKLQDRCRQEARECKGRIQVLEANLQEQSDFEEEFSLSCAEIETKRKKLQELAVSISEASLACSRLKQEISELSFTEIKTESAKARVRDLEIHIEGLARRDSELNFQISRIQETIRQADFIGEQFRQFEICKAAAENMDLKAAKHSELISRRLELRSKVAMHQGRMEVEIEHLGATIQSKSKEKAELEKACKDRESIESSYKEYRKLLEAELEMSRKRETYSTLSSRADELQSLIGEARIRLEAQIQQKEILLREVEQLLESRHQIENEQDMLQAELCEAEKAESEYELIEEKGIKLKSQIDNLQQQISQLKKYIRTNEEKMHELCRTPDLSSCPLCRAPIVDSKAVLDRYEFDNKNADKEIYNVETQIASLTDERDRLRKKYLELRKRISERKIIDMRIGEFNERKSALERAENTKKELESDIASARQKLEQHSFAPVEKESLVRVKAELNKLEFDPIVFSSFQAQMRAQRHIEVRYQQYTRDSKALESLAEELPEIEDRLNQMLDSLKSGLYCPEEREEINLLDQQIAELNYDKYQHQYIKSKLAELLPFAEKAKEIAKSEAELPSLLSEQDDNSGVLEARRNELRRLQEEIKNWEQDLHRLPECREFLQTRETLLSELENEKNELKSQLILLEARLQQLQSDKSQLDTRKKLLAESIKEMGEYQVLAEAFGKKGIQAIIIDNAIPEIEVEANRILSRLSDNRMHLALLTQVRSRQGNPLETLEIIIADELGTRNYELYSGGEAFKVNFALRVAMSRLLARRAGAKLETLIIDEGFGSQDEFSRGKLIQAISSIQSDFARIIVVTHIAEVKEMFPIHIAVSKEEGVSKVAVS